MWVCGSIKCGRELLCQGACNHPREEVTNDDALESPDDSAASQALWSLDLRVRHQQR